jgi:hypothetical protein
MTDGEDRALVPANDFLIDANGMWVWFKEIVIDARGFSIRYRDGREITSTVVRWNSAAVVRDLIFRNDYECESEVRMEFRGRIKGMWI